MRKVSVWHTNSVEFLHFVHIFLWLYSGSLPKVMFFSMVLSRYTHVGQEY